MSLCVNACVYFLWTCTDLSVYRSVSFLCVYSLHHLITLCACAADAFVHWEHIDFVYWPNYGVCVCVKWALSPMCVCVCVYPCPTPGPLSGCGFPFPVPVSRLAPNSDDICSVFVVDLDKGPYGLGMGLIDGLVSLCIALLKCNTGSQCSMNITL